MLGVRREGHTEAAGKLQDAGSISYRRGSIAVRMVGRAPAAPAGSLHADGTLGESMRARDIAGTSAGPRLAQPTLGVFRRA